jgi:hypothetical protein
MKNKNELDPAEKINKRYLKIYKALFVFVAFFFIGRDLPEIFILPFVIAFIYYVVTFFTSSGNHERDKELMLTNRSDIANIEDVTSYPVTTNQNSGYTFSKLSELKDFSEKKGVYIDNFAYFPEMKQLANKDILKESKQTKINIDNADFTKTLMVLGGMGSGKTEFFHSILNQRAFSRSIIHDVKGDFVQKWYDSKKDFIFNPYDERGFVWDLWAEMDENEALIESFINNLMRSETEEKDFFTGTARKVIIDMFMQVHFMFKGETAKEKWTELNKLIKEYGEQASDNKTKSSVYATMELIIDLFEFFEYQSGKENVKAFSFKEFLSGNGTLFLLNNPSVSKKLNPLFTSFVALLIEKLLSRPDTKEDLTLLLLDEYLSLVFDKDTRLKLLTQIRSKGGCLILGMQYLPKKDKEHEQLLDSSCYGTIIFKLNDNETVKHIVTSMGEVEYISATENENKKDKKINYSKTTKTKKFLTSEHLQSMPQYTHLSLFLGDSKIYLGYTELVKMYPRYENFIKRDMKEFYEFKYGREHKYRETIAQKNPNLTAENIKENKDFSLDFDTLENGFEVDSNGIEYDPIKTEEKRNSFTAKEREAIIEEWLDSNTEEQLELSKKYDLENVSLLLFLGEENEEN